MTQNYRRTQTKHRKAKKGQGWTKLERTEVDCIWVNLKTSAHLFSNLYQFIYNGDWTEWSGIWSEIIRVISKSSSSSIWNHKYDFRPKLHDPKFNYHFIRSILKSHNFMALNFRVMFCSKPSRFVRNSGTGNALTSYLVCKTMSCDENSCKHNKQTNKQWTKTASFMHKSSILVAWINDGKSSLLLWLPGGALG